MELKIGIKEEHEEFLNQIGNEFSLDGIEKTIQILVVEILKKFDSKHNII